ncbi:AAA domain-containing protein [Clostridium sp. A1-XYC3]|uniref:AAA domain-containing protein n=1 Tax=Clostridium tanneri TaxID=3037988 RepID=A0ABU4JTA0_9CLOT|nr:AAA domain-containing protein [Clostridium sp. A1-XYC3]MDW8801360.1 AAA domain-containing protein [Clostridium sp. A1-XYC3]
MNTREKIKNIFLYLLSIKNMDKKIIRDVTKYNKIIWEADLYNKKGCMLNKNEDENWLQVGKEHKELYNSLFKIYCELEKNSEDLEIVWGHSLLTWKVNDEKIVHPIFTTKMSLNFNAEKGLFILTPYNNITNLELGVLEGLDLPNLHELININLEIKNMGIDARKIEDIENILQRILNSLGNTSSSIDFKKDIAATADIKTEMLPTFYNAPCIILRNIDTRLWDMELRDILNYIDENKPIPKTVEALVKEINAVGINDDYNEWESIGKDLLFPLPANEEQEEITKRLAKNFGVVVQGPPGTGKSHTIVNLICHLMAHGKRVLVTSQTDRALKVLSNKIPDEIKALCMSLLGNDAKALKELDEAVRKITENLSIDPASLIKEIAPLENELKECRKTLEHLKQDLKEAESFENKTVSYKTETLSVTELAKWVRSNEKYNWIEDEIHLKTRCPITEEEFNLLIKLLRESKKDEIDKLNKTRDLLYKIPSYEELVYKLDRLQELELNIHKYREDVNHWIIDTSESNLDQLLKLSIKAKEKISQIENCWLKSVMKSCYSNDASKEYWKDIILNLNNYVRQISVLKQIVNSHNIKFPNNMDINKLQSDFEVIYKHIESKGKLSSIFKVFHSNVNYIIEECEVDYRTINSKEQCDIFAKAIEKENLERQLRTLWNNTVKEYGGKLVTTADNNLLSTISDNVIELQSILDWEEEYANTVIELLGNSKTPVDLNLFNKQAYEYLLNGLQSIKYIKEYEELNKYIENARKLFLSNDYLMEASDWIADFDKIKIRKLYDTLWRLKELKDAGEQISRILSKLKETCPVLTKKLLTKWESNDLNTEYINWDKAWKWRASVSLLNEICKLRPEQIEKDMEAEKIREKTLIKEIVAKKTWYNQIIRTTESQKRSLFTWLESIKRIGKGTGKQAAKYRKLAQKEMEKCKGVIPVWIMPLNKVIENIKLENDLFDVVIMDESSQSDISAITALLRGKRAVIVGDECQISPEAIGKDNEMVENLINRYLKDIPHGEWFDLKTSLYHTALRVFPSRLVLKEHFRCAPEIIGFSNDLCYSNEIIPLRCPEKRDTFNPAVFSVKVEEGFKDSGKNINQKEAEALVNKVIDCCKDDKYKDMTMGVISLLGEAQSELIENMLKEKLGVEEMINRKILCGDAYSFQGDERDIMFLSLVIAKNAKFTALTKESDIRRFNVASSRAKNQMFLFHSVDFEDLNSKCVRASLLGYFMNNENKPVIYVEGNSILSSGFKKDIYTELKSRGYKVKTDVRVGRYKIDFVIEGTNSRLAVDCCCENTAFSLNWEENHNRRMTLQRVGWNFFIIRESQFYYQPKKCMEKLYTELEANGIRPSFSKEQSLSLAEASFTNE